MAAWLDSLRGHRSLDHFVKEVWGKREQLSRVDSDDELKALVEEGFCGGDLASILECSRHEDNSSYTPEEIDNIKQDHEVHRKTINPLFCFSEGALSLLESFYEAFGSTLGNDVEIGLYFSKPGGDIANWHFDNNHNITIQLDGTKDWYTMPGDPNTVASRGMTGYDIGKNMLEQGCDVPSTDMRHSLCTRLKPGDVFYLPPGHWHQVVPVEEGESGSVVSVDIRISNVVRTKWLAEAYFMTNMMKAQYSAKNKLDSAFTATWRMDGDILSPEEWIRFCPMPLWIPFERGVSDGLDRRATVDFLLDKMHIELVGDYERVRRNPMIAMNVKRGAQETVYIQLVSVSSLTSAEYMRFTIVWDLAPDCAGEIIRELAHHTDLMQDYVIKPSASHISLTKVLAVLEACNAISRPDPKPQGKSSKKRDIEGNIRKHRK